MKFEIDPYVGPLPIRFQMTPDTVRAVLGPPVSVLPDPLESHVEERPNVMIGYSKSDGQIYEVVFWPGAPLMFSGQALFELPDPIAFLRQFDGSPFQWVGSVVFLKLGIRLSGYHDGDESQKAIGVVKRGYWDEYIIDFVPYEPKDPGIVQNNETR